MSAEPVSTPEGLSLDDEAVRSWAAMVADDLRRIDPLPASHEYALMSHLLSALRFLDAALDAAEAVPGLEAENARLRKLASFATHRPGCRCYDGDEYPEVPCRCGYKDAHAAALRPQEPT